MPSPFSSPDSAPSTPTEVLPAPSPRPCPRTSGFKTHRTIQPTANGDSPGSHPAVGCQYTHDRMHMMGGLSTVILLRRSSQSPPRRGHPLGGFQPPAIRDQNLRPGWMALWVISVHRTGVSIVPRSWILIRRTKLFVIFFQRLERSTGAANDNREVCSVSNVIQPACEHIPGR